MHARVPVIFSIQETKSWDVPNLTLLDMCVMVASLGSQRCGFRSSFSQSRDRGDSKRDKQQFSSGPLWRWPLTLQTQVEAWRCTRPFSRASFKCFGKYTVVEPEISTFQGDPNVELGMMCTDEKDIEEFNEMCGPVCWQGYDQDPEGFKKLMWYGIRKEFNCKAPSTWSKCERAKETPFTHRQFGDRRQE